MWPFLFDAPLIQTVSNLTHKSDKILKIVKQHFFAQAFLKVFAMVDNQNLLGFNQLNPQKMVEFENCQCNNVNSLTLCFLITLQCLYGCQYTDVVSVIMNLR